MENFDLEAIFAEISAWFATLNMEEVFNKITEVVNQIVEFVTCLVG